MTEDHDPCWAMASRLVATAATKLDRLDAGVSSSKCDWGPLLRAEQCIPSTLNGTPLVTG